MNQKKKISFQVFLFADVDLRDETSKLYVSTQIMANAYRKGAPQQTDKATVDFMSNCDEMERAKHDKMKKKGEKKLY